MKKFLSLILSVIMLFAISVNCLAVNTAAVSVKPYDGEIETYDDDIEPRAPVEPSDHKSLVEPYTAELIDLAATKSSITIYYFSTQTSEIHLNFDLERSGTSTIKRRTLTAHLYEKVGQDYLGSEIDSVSVSFTGTSYSCSRKFQELDPDNFYYIKFTNDSDSSQSSRADISGTIVISQD